MLTAPPVVSCFWPGTTHMSKRTLVHAGMDDEDGPKKTVEMVVAQAFGLAYLARDSLTMVSSLLDQVPQVGNVIKSVCLLSVDLPASTFQSAVTRGCQLQELSRSVTMFAGAAQEGPGAGQAA